MTRAYAGLAALGLALFSGCSRPAANSEPDTAAKQNKLTYGRVGDTLTVDETGAERMHIEVGDEGVSLPKDFPADVPIYPGATVTRSFEIDDMVSVTLTTPDPADKVAAFYEEQLKQQGWTIPVKFGDENAGMGSARKGDRTLSVIVDREGTAAGVVIRLMTTADGNKAPSPTP